MQALVTGSTGLLGGNLVRALEAEGDAVRALARSREKAARVFADCPVQVIEGDLENIAAWEAALDDCEVVFHLAAYFREYYTAGDHWRRLRSVNVDATIELLEAALRHGVRRVVFVSSAGVYAVPADGSEVDESGPLDGDADNLYFRSKVLAEDAIVEWRRDHELEVVTIQPGWMFGPHDNAPTSAGQVLIDLLRRKLPGIPPGGSSVADARDVAAAMVAAAHYPEPADRYIVAGRSTTLAEIVGAFEKATGMPVPRRRLPYAVVLTAARVSELWASISGGSSSLSVSGIRTMRHHGSIRYSSARAVADLGVSFRPLEETIRDAVSWIRDAGMA